MSVIEIRTVSSQMFLLITDKSYIWTGEMKIKNCFTLKYNVSPAWPDHFTNILSLYLIIVTFLDIKENTGTKQGWKISMPLTRLSLQMSTPYLFHSWRSRGKVGAILFLCSIVQSCIFWCTLLQLLDVRGSPWSHI